MKFPRLDLVLVIPVCCLLIVSLTIMASVAPHLLNVQLIAMGIGLVVFFIISWLGYELFFSLHWITYITLIGLSLVTVIFGYISRGAQRWINLGPLNLQPSEIIKPFLLITFAVIASSAIKSRHLLLIGLGILPMILIYLQPDLGTTLVIFVGWASTIVSRLPLKFSVAVGLITALIAVPIYFFGLQDYQRQRISAFINPYADPLGQGYQVIQSTIAVGSGQVIGRGLGHGTQTQLKFLPEHHTDFIFASISEEMGFVGAVICLILYTVIFWRIYVISQSVGDPAASLFCLSSLALLAFQTFVNIGMNIGLAPITGITLPLLSYGGSSLISVGIILGLINTISRHFREDQILVIH